METPDLEPGRRVMSSDGNPSERTSLKLPAAIVGLISVLGVAIGALSVITAVGFGLLDGRSMGFGSAEMPSIATSRWGSLVRRQPTTARLKCGERYSLR